MADKRDVFDDEPISRNNEPRLSHTLDMEPDPSTIGQAPIGSQIGKGKSKQVPWHKNSEVVKVVVAGAVVLVLVLVVLIWQFGLFGGSSPSKPKIAASQPASQPTPQPNPQPSQPVPDAAQQPPPAAQPGQQTPPPVEFANPNQPPTQPPPGSTTDKPAQPQLPPLPEKVAEWKVKHYYRARKENNPKLVEAVAYMGQTFPGRKDVAELLTKLLAPLPPEKPVEQPAPGQTPPVAPGQTPPAAPGQAQPAAPVAPPVDPNQPLPAAPGQAQPVNPGLPPPPPEAAMTPGLAPPGANPNNPVNQPLAGLVEAIIAALGNNGSETALNTIEQVLAGTFKTDDDKIAVEAALKALLAHPRAETDALMLRVLTAPNELRPIERQGPWPFKDLQAKALELTKQSASSGLRLELAKAIINLHVKLDPKDSMHEFLLASNPLNCGAQLALYEKGNLTAEQKTTLEDQFLGYGSLAMARLLGIPDNLDQPNSPSGNPEAPAGPQGGLLGGFDAPGDRLTGPKDGSDKPLGPSTESGGNAGAGENKTKASDNPASRVAAGLWAPKFLALLEPKLTTHAVDSLEKKSKLVLLAGTIPQDSTRSLLNTLLRKRWDEGPKALETAGLADKIVTDPGMLTLIKMLPRKDSKSAKGAPAAPAGGVVNKRIAEAQKKQQMSQEWWDLSAKLAPLWCKRFHAATQARQKGDAGAEGDASVPLKLPKGFELSSNARVTASYYLSWPSEAPTEIAELKPGLLEVYYIRIEEVNTIRKATAYYSRKADLRSADAKTIDKSTWLDNVRIGSQKDRRQSLDILITPPQNYVPAEKAKDEDETDLTVEILLVEIKDPNK